MTRHRAAGDRRRKGFFCISAASIGIGLVPTIGFGQTWASTVNGFWSDPLNWTSLPISGTTTAIRYQPTLTQSFVSTDDIPGPFVLNSLTLAGSSTGSLTVATGSLSTLRFDGTSPTILVSQPGATAITGRIRRATDTTITIQGGAG